MTTERDLQENAEEFLREAGRAMDNQSYNAAVALYFKAIAVLTDLFILKKEGMIPSNHAERFRLLQRKYPEIYRIHDKDFPIYQDSYKTKLTKEYAEVLAYDTRKLIKITGIDLTGKGIHKKP
ncbi:MAG: hypothetical protein V1743_08250 [Nanoarchaeota archaeon]